MVKRKFLDDSGNEIWLIAGSSGLRKKVVEEQIAEYRQLRKDIEGMLERARQKGNWEKGNL